MEYILNFRSPNLYTIIIITKINLNKTIVRKSPVNEVVVDY